MDKIQWKPKNSRTDVSAQVGSIYMGCHVYHISKTGSRSWCAYVSVCLKGGTFRFGASQTSMKRAKDDAVRMARELLLDYQLGLEAEMANFDLE